MHRCLWLEEIAILFLKIEFIIYHKEKAFGEESDSMLTIWDWSILNFSFGFSFGSNDGRYEDYMYQKAEYDFYIDKYQTTFDYYDEYVPIPEE